MKAKILAIPVCLVAFVTHPVFAQTSQSALSLAAQQYPQQELDELRAQLLNLTDAVEKFAKFTPWIDVDSLHEAKAKIQTMPSSQLNALRQVVNPSQIMSRLERVQLSINSFAKSADGVRAMSYSDPTSLPNANGLCTSANGTNTTRIPTSVVLAADVTWFTADGVREAAQDACKQELVVAGEGGNTSTACIIVDAVWITAKAVDEGIHFCDDDLTGAVIDANYARLADVHTDVNNVGTTLDTHITSANTDIDNKIGALDTHLTNANTDIDNKIAALSALTVTLIGNLSGQITAATNQLVAGQQQIMKLDLTPEGARQLVGAILTCDGTALKPCPAVLVACQANGCTWNKVGPLP